MNIGYGNMANASRIIALVSPDSAPVKRLVQDARDAGRLVDGTAGRRTRAVLVMDSDHVVLSPLLPELYNTTGAVKALAVRLLWVSAAMMPVNGYTNACYFTLRCGGKTLITFLFDSAFVWTVCLPVAYVLSRMTALPILPMVVIVNALDLIKCAVGFFLVRSKKWVNNLVST